MRQPGANRVISVAFCKSLGVLLESDEGLTSGRSNWRIASKRPQELFRKKPRLPLKAAEELET